MSDFYISLHSNASSSIFPDNMVSSFKNQFSNTIQLNHKDWEVAVTECSYIYGHVLIRKGEELVWVHTWRTRTPGQWKDDPTPKDVYEVESHRVVASKDLRSLSQVMEDLIKAIPNHEFKISNEILSIYLDESQVAAVQFPDKVCAMLGLTTKAFKTSKFAHQLLLIHSRGTREKELRDAKRADVLEPSVTPTEEIDNSDNEIDGKTVYVIRGNMSIFERAGSTKLFIYCNIIEPQYVADVLAPCLRIVPYKGEFRSLEHHSFLSPQFMNVNVSEFDYIHIYILNEVGEPVNFEFAPFSLTLRFREKKRLK